jgi:clan AA aspartic protease (TIGR02281 family)
VVTSKQSTLRGTHDDDGIEIPVVVNGKRATYLIDTGTSTSTITAPEASRLGLAVTPVPGFVVSDANDEEIPTNATLVKELKIGGIRITNVLFLVGKDDTGGRGIIGMNVLEMLGTIRWTDKGAIEIGFPSAAFDLAGANFYLGDGDGPLIDARYSGKPILAYFDSGGESTQFFGRFGDAFPDLKKIGKPIEIHLNGSASKRTLQGLKLPLIEIELGGATVAIQDETLLTDDRIGSPGNAHIWLGLEALSKAPHVSLDFRAMRFSLQ